MIFLRPWVALMPTPGVCSPAPESLKYFAFALIGSYLLLFVHFFAVAFYSIWCMFTHARLVPSSTLGGGKMIMKRPGLEEYPLLAIRSVQVVSDDEDVDYISYRFTNA